MADADGQFEKPRLEDIVVQIAFAVAAQWYVKQAGLLVPSGDLGFRCPAELCRKPLVPVPSRPDRPAHFEHLEQNPACPFQDVLIRESRISGLPECLCTVEAAAAIGGHIGRNLGNDNSSFVREPRPRKPTLDISRASVEEPRDDFVGHRDW
jgi:hypothetical protein